MLKIKRLHSDAIIPRYQTAGAIGLDLHACIEEHNSFLRPPRSIEVEYGRVISIRTGIAVQIPNGYYGRIAPRSGLAKNQGIDVLAGVVDADYRGELIVLMTKLARIPDTATIQHGERIAQLILERADQIEIQEVEELDDTSRGAGNFGSTGG